MDDGILPTEEQKKTQKRRSAAIGIGLSAFVVIVFLVTYFKLVQGAVSGGI